MASWMQIGLEVHRTERAHQEGSLALDRQQFPSTTGSNDSWHSVQRKQNTWKQFKMHVRLSGWGRSWSVCSAHIYIPQWYIVIIRVALNSWLILCFMIDLNILISGIIYQRLCATEDHVASVHSYRGSGCIYSNEGAHHEKIQIP